MLRRWPSLLHDAPTQSICYLAHLIPLLGAVHCPHGACPQTRDPIQAPSHEHQAQPKTSRVWDLLHSLGSAPHGVVVYPPRQVPKPRVREASAVDDNDEHEEAEVEQLDALEQLERQHAENRRQAAAIKAELGLS